MRLQKIHWVRVSGYLVATIATIFFFQKNSTNAWTHSWLYQLYPVWAVCGWSLIYYKIKNVPLAHVEKIFSTVFQIVFIITWSLRLIFILLTK